MGNVHRNRNKNRQLLAAERRKHTEDGSVYPAEIVHKGDPILLKDRSILRSETVVHGQYEKAFKGLLLELNLTVWYEGITFEINKTDKYPPDFVTNLFVGGKQVIIELHHANQQYLARMGRFRELYGDRFYYILVKSCPEGIMGTSVEVGKNGSHGEQVDEFWIMPSVRESGRNGYSDGGEQVWKDKMRRELGRFIDERADKCEDCDAAMARIDVRRAG